MNRTIKVIGFTVLTLVQPALAQDGGSSMSLKQCINYALTNNPTGVIYENQVAVAQHQNKEGYSAYLPQVNVSASLDDNIKRQTTIIPAGAFSPAPLEIQFGNQYAATVNGQVDQVIYDQTLITSLKASKVNIQLAELNQEKNESAIIYNTASAYYQVLILQEQLQLVKDNEQMMEQLVAVQKLQFDKGVIQETAFNRIRVNYNNLISQREQIELNLSIALERLKNYMGMEAGEQLNVANSINFETDVPMPEQTEIEVTEMVDYKILETNIQLQEFDLKRKQAQFLPSVGAYARYGANAFGNEFNTTFDKWYDYAAIGLKVNIPLFSGLRRYSQLKQSELILNNTRQNLLVNSNAYKLQLKSSQVKLNASYLTLQSNKENLELATEVYELTSLQYQKGVVVLSDFLNADYARKEAESNYINSMLNYFISRIDIEQSKGTLKEFVNNL